MNNVTFKGFSNFSKLTYDCFKKSLSKDNTKMNDIFSKMISSTSIGNFDFEKQSAEFYKKCENEYFKYDSNKSLKENEQSLQRAQAKLNNYSISLPVEKSSLFWYGRIIIKMPFSNKKPELPLLDKDYSIGMVMSFLQENSDTISKKVTILLFPGCDTNEAGTKLRFCLESIDIKTKVIASDLNFQALAITRVSDNLLSNSLKEREIEPATILYHDCFSKEPLITCNESESLKVSLPFRLSTSIQVNELEYQLKKLLQSGDLVVLHFLEKTDKTINGLCLLGYENKELTTTVVEEQIFYLETKTTEKINITLWNEKILNTVISKFNGEVLKIDKVATTDDSGKTSTCL